MAFPNIEVYSEAERKQGEWSVFGLKLVEDTSDNRERAAEGCAGCCYKSERYALTNGDDGAPIVAACTGFEKGTASGDYGTVEFFEASLSVRTPEDEENQLPIQKKAPPCSTKFSLQLGST